MNDKIYAVDKPLLGMWSVGLWEVGMSEAGIPPQLPLCSPSFLLIDTPPPILPCRAGSPCGPTGGWYPGSRPLLTPGLGEHWKGPS